MWVRKARCGKPYPHSSSQQEMTASLGPPFSSWGWRREDWAYLLRLKWCLKELKKYLQGRSWLALLCLRSQCSSISSHPRPCKLLPFLHVWVEDYGKRERLVWDKEANKNPENFLQARVGRRRSKAQEGQRTLVQCSWKWVLETGLMGEEMSLEYGIVWKCRWLAEGIIEYWTFWNGRTCWKWETKPWNIEGGSWVGSRAWEGDHPGVGFSVKSWETHIWSPKFIHSTAVGLTGRAGTSASHKDCVPSDCEEGTQRGAVLASAGDKWAAIRPTAGKHFCQIENPVISFPILFHSLSPRISVNRSCQRDSGSVPPPAAAHVSWQPERWVF